MIIPFFIPHSGCPHRCVFCNQKKITGEHDQPLPESIPAKIADYLKTDKKKRPVQVAFYGGTFTALPLDTQRRYLMTVTPFIEAGKVESIRLSTRPDCISEEILSLLAEHRVSTVELGAQSMDDSVLAGAGRGHTTADTVGAVALLRKHAFSVGIQLMPGLPEDTRERFFRTVDKTLEIKPDIVRIYPALVIKDTLLEKLYYAGQYTPLSLDEAVSWCKIALGRFEEAGIKVIRMGLQPTEELLKPGTIVKGPYHPSFRQLVQTSA
jgi:histone acetyltransferase (RNA polymerase elongator complex component)